MIEYLSYILFFTTLIIFIFYIYIRLKYGFWAVQPVFHVYNLLYMFNPPGVISGLLPDKNKYTNFKNIDTSLYVELTQIQKQRLVNLIQANYLQRGDNTFMPRLENIAPYFTGHNDKSFVSFYNEPNFLIDLKKGTTINEQKNIGLKEKNIQRKNF